MWTVGCSTRRRSVASTDDSEVGTQVGTHELSDVGQSWANQKEKKVWLNDKLQ